MIKSFWVSKSILILSANLSNSINTCIITQFDFFEFWQNISKFQHSILRTPAFIRLMLLPRFDLLNQGTLRRTCLGACWLSTSLSPLTSSRNRFLMIFTKHTLKKLKNSTPNSILFLNLFLMKLFYRLWPNLYSLIYTSTLPIPNLFTYHRISLIILKPIMFWLINRTTFKQSRIIPLVIQRNTWTLLKILSFFRPLVPIKCVISWRLTFSRLDL